MLHIPHLTPLIPEIFILSMIAVVLLAGLFVKPKLSGRVSYLLTQVTLIGVSILAFRFYTTDTVTAFNHMFINDPLGQILKLFVYVTTIFSLAYAKQYIEDRALPQMEYYLLTLFTVLGMMVVISANHLLVLYVGLELFSLPLYAMVALQRDSVNGSEAAMKYFVTGAVASGLLLYGISLLFGTTNSLDLTVINHTLAVANTDLTLVYQFALVFIVAGVIFKLGAAPFHMWAPDVYEGAPTSVTLFIGGAAKLAALGLVYRFFVFAMPTLHITWQPILMTIAIVSMALGNIVAIVQTNIKRMLAYSSIAHMGYLLLGILAGTPAGYSASFFYMITYSIMAVGAFGFIVILSAKGIELDTIESLKGLNARNPWLALMMLLIMFSMAGIPPAVGFFAKLGVLEALISVHLVWLATIALIFAIIGAYYYLRIIKVMYFEEPEVSESSAIPVTGDLRFVMSLNGLAVLLLGLFPSTLIDLCRSAF